MNVSPWPRQNPPGLIAEITSVAFALAGNTLFPVFLLGIWWDRANKYGAVTGMVVGIVLTFTPVLAVSLLRAGLNPLPFLLGLTLFVFDLFWQWFFQLIGFLEIPADQTPVK